jgi:hypothetical protein
MLPHSPLQFTSDNSWRGLKIQSNSVNQLRGLSSGCTGAGEAHRGRQHNRRRRQNDVWFGQPTRTEAMGPEGPRLLIFALDRL